MPENWPVALPAGHKGNRNLGDLLFSANLEVCA